MRRLVVMRHAKAEGHGEKPDIDRELVARGREDAAHVGQSLAEAGLVPDRVLCSSARRTRDTLAALLPVFRGDCVIQLQDLLYKADANVLRDALRTAKGQCVLLIGHNPSVHALAQAFAADHPGAGALRASFPTSAAAVFSMGFAIDSVRFDRLVLP